MGRELEFKYRASKEILEAVRRRYGNFISIAMETTYFDTANADLKARHWMLRSRLENGESVCTLKTPLPDGSRGEWETKCNDITLAMPLLVELGAPEALLELSNLQPICSARFLRLAGLVALENASVELALDQGVFLGNGQSIPFCELEVEYKSGSEAAAAQFAQALAQEYHLTREPKSKVQRAMALVHCED